MTLPPAFLDRPIAHRALHDVADSRPENSRAAIRAAIEHGYGIEIDLQLSQDGQAMVFHDYDLARLSKGRGPIQMQPSDVLSKTSLLGGDEGIPTFAQVLDLVAGRVPLLIELKDQDGAMGPDVGALEQATCDLLASYQGPAALMSFNPHSVACCATMAPDIPRGIVTSAYSPEHWPQVPAARRTELAQINDLDRVGACFISHEAAALSMPRVAQIKEAGHKVLTWTIRSAAQETKAREIADNVTFEGYLA